MREAGKLVVFEGIGGCGKGTQIEMLRKHLETRGKSVLVTCEHTRDTPPGELIEDIIKKRKPGIDPTALQLLFVADRVNHTEKIIKPGLENFDFVLADRYKGSTISYALPEKRKYFLEIQKEVTLTPALVMVLDLDSEEAARRVDKRGDADIFDTSKRLRVCLESYQWYAKNSGDPCVWIDGSGTREEVHGRIVKEIQTRNILSPTV